MTIKDYEEQEKQRKDKIRQEPNKFKRFWKWVWHLLTFPFIWLFYNIRDWRTMVIYLIVTAVVSIEVWLPYLLGVITWGTDFSKIMFSVGSACWIFWLGPGTPFIPLCISITIGVKALFNKIKSRHSKTL